MREIRAAYDSLGSKGVKAQIVSDTVEFWTFAGTRMNRLLANLLDPNSDRSSFDHRSILLKGSLSADEILVQWGNACDAVKAGAMISPSERQTDLIKFSEAVPTALLRSSIAHRLEPHPRTIDSKVKFEKINQ
jgi:hypothetical protein